MIPFIDKDKLTKIAQSVPNLVVSNCHGTSAFQTGKPKQKLIHRHPLPPLSVHDSPYFGFRRGVVYFR